MNFENIPPGLLQQLMSQLNGMNEEAELPEEEQSEEIDSDLIIPPTPLSDSTTDLILIKYLAKDLPISETQQDYFTLYL
jgi:Putative zinc finger in N-recognin (UBR box)